MELNPQVVSVFPNPSSGKFTVTVRNRTINAIDIYNMMGTKVFSSSERVPKSTKDITLFNYLMESILLQIYDQGRIYTKKMLQISKFIFIKTKFQIRKNIIFAES